jgi:hypothetical protein
MGNDIFSAFQLKLHFKNDENHPHAYVQNASSMEIVEDDKKQIATKKPIQQPPRPILSQFPKHPGLLRKQWMVSEQQWQIAELFFKQYPNEIKLHKKLNPHLGCSFIKTTQGHIFAIMPGLKTVYGKTTLGEGGNGKVKLCKARNGHDFAVKIDGSPINKEHELFIMQSLGELGGIAYRTNHKGHFKGFPAQVKNYTITNLYQQDLYNFLQSNQLNQHEKLKLAICSAHAIKTMHDLGIIHCDIKPGNLMLNSQMQVKAIDFGAAKIIGSQPFISSSPLTTFEYSEPSLKICYELYHNRNDRTKAAYFNFSKSSDIYSLGKMFSEDFKLEMPAGFWTNILNADPSKRMDINNLILVLEQALQHQNNLVQALKPTP